MNDKPKTPVKATQDVSIDREFAALEVIVKALKPLSEAERCRVVKYVADRFEVDY